MLYGIKYLLCGKWLVIAPCFLTRDGAEREIVNLRSLYPVASAHVFGVLPR